MEAVTVERSIWINAPRERVWEAITQPEQLKQWWGLGWELATLQQGASMKFHGTDGNWYDATIESVNPTRQFTLRWAENPQYPATFMTTFTLDEQDGGTRVTVVESGFEQLPIAVRQQHVEGNRHGWMTVLPKLKTWTEREQSTPDGFTLERSIWINAPREQVWQAVTEQEQLTKWFAPGSIWHIQRLAVGGTALFYNTPDDVAVHTIEVIDTPHQFTLRWEEAPGVTMFTTFWLVEEKGGTRVTVQESGFEQLAAPTRDTRIQQTSTGYDGSLHNLKALVEQGSVPA